MRGRDAWTPSLLRRRRSVRLRLSSSDDNEGRCGFAVSRFPSCCAGRRPITLTGVQRRRRRARRLDMGRIVSVILRSQRDAEIDRAAHGQLFVQQVPWLPPAVRNQRGSMDVLSSFRSSLSCFRPTGLTRRWQRAAPLTMEVDMSCTVVWNIPRAFPGREAQALQAEWREYRRRMPLGTT